MDFPLWLWSVPVAAFAALEAAALLSSRGGDTASEVIRRIAGIRPARPWRPLGIAVITGFCAWLANHLING